MSRAVATDDPSPRVQPFGLVLGPGPTPGDIPALPLRSSSGTDADRVNGQAQGDGAPRLVWHHLDRLDPATYAAIWDDPEITEHATEAMLAEDTRPRVLVTATGIVLILRGANLNPGADPSEMLALRMWVGGNRVVTVSTRPLRAVDDVRELVGHDDHGATTPMGVIVHLGERLTARMEPSLESIDQRLDEIEDQLFGEDLPTGMRQKIGALRREASNFRRFMEPQHQAIESMAKLTSPLMLQSHRERLIELGQQVRRDVEDLDAHREQAIVAHDELASRLAESLNGRIYLLSVVAAIMLPLSLLAGLLGSNVAGIPGANDPMAFWVVLLMMLVMGLAILGLLKWKKWI